jgi:hypothetical protein
MKKSIYPALFVLLLILFANTAFAITPMIAQPLDLPPEAIDFEGDPVTNPFRDPNIMAAGIGVGGLLLGSFITILATYMMRWMDNRREDKREDLLILRNKKEKEYQMKQEIYRHFLNELADLETFSMPSLDEFKREWNRTEIKVDLIASEKVREHKQTLQAELLNLAEKNIKEKKSHLSDKFMTTRDELLEAIREDIDILQPQK